MASLFVPFGNCAEFLNTKVVTTILAPAMEVAVKFVTNLNENDLKEKVDIFRKCPHCMHMYIYICIDYAAIEVEIQ